MGLEALVPTLLWGLLGIVYWYTFKLPIWLDSKLTLKSSSFKDFLCVWLWCFTMLVVSLATLIVWEATF